MVRLFHFHHPHSKTVPSGQGAKVHWRSTNFAFKRRQTQSYRPVKRSDVFPLVGEHASCRHGGAGALDTVATSLSPLHDPILDGARGVYSTQRHVNVTVSIGPGTPGPATSGEGDGLERATRIHSVLLASSTLILFQHRLTPSSNLDSKQRASSTPNITSPAGADVSYSRDRRKASSFTPAIHPAHASAQVQGKDDDACSSKGCSEL